MEVVNYTGGVYLQTGDTLYIIHLEHLEIPVIGQLSMYTRVYLHTFYALSA